MTKQDFYKALCVEAGTFDAPGMDADEWYEQCRHNITQGQDEDLALAATGDAQAISDARQSVGLSIFV